ncbi:MAG: transcription-repair coupling factor [Bacteroides sp.]|nr:transcription-repair coupling factor [Eubacterium sp.]MCM1418505.1 transcription-repair coupling factor [Roseburia sp.]MCM1462524.1 transcription-repair coupling factor [Bacteroides sp.]
MEYFFNTARQLPEYRAVAAARGGLPVMVTGLSHIHKAHFLAALSREEGFSAPLLVLCDTEGECARLCADINVMSGGETAVVYPAKDLMLGEVDSASREYVLKRLGVLYRMAAGNIPIVCATPEAAVQLTVPRDALLRRSVSIRTGDTLSLTALAEKLTALGYDRFDQIEGVAQFSVRGSIFDVYPVNFPAPIRIEMFDDTVDSISTFDLETQRRIDTVKAVAAAPATELLFEDNAAFARALTDFSAKVRGKNAPSVKARLAADIEKLDSGITPDGDRYLPLCFEKEATVFDYAAGVIVCENSACNDSLKSALAQHREDLKMLFEEGVLAKGLDRYLLTKAEYDERLEGRVRAYFDNFMRGHELRLSALMTVSAGQVAPWSGEYRYLLEELRSYMAGGYSVIVLAGTEKGARVLADDLRADGIPADYADSPKKLFMKRVYVTKGFLTSGYSYPEARLAAISHTAVSVSVREKPKRKKAEMINSLGDVAVGDLVVHNSYGIGVFEGVQKLTQDRISKDYIKIRYAGTDVLYVPVTQLDLISRYIGSGDVTTVKLSKMHTDQWQRAKTRAKAAAKEMASELTALYAKRMKSKGYAFDPDGEEQTDFENHFSYVETDDQLRCIAEIKRDMETDRPMERLLCGDVGFGKTEVALRAAFKCIMSGKQCALLCPTTVLAWQHYQTVVKRMEGFPVKVELLSRFRTAKEIKQSIERMKRGSADMVIGTHRLVQDDVGFKDLGLVIIDEEQRFGVGHKDKFKEMFPGVDILTLSATPIPRTLNMAMSGIRDMSVIETPPQDRQPVTTYVIEHNEGVLIQAIRKELRRNGQVYYIHNRIESITQCAAQLHALIPEARIGIAHGRMEEGELLEIWRKLLEHEIDVLVCTTLIETGVDVPNCNTLIIENADYMGLAQLHQLRGRVGRTNRRAFAYFTFRRGKTLSEVAAKRLDAIREFTKFGSGFRIAMRDLEIRGAGSILGASQSGHMSAVGYDMYLKLLDEAVKEERGEVAEPVSECLVDVKADAFIPEDYIANPARRISCYKRIAMIRSEDDAYDVTDELIDRYGEPPKPVYGLIEVARVRSMAQEEGITEILQTKDTLSFFLPKPDVRRIAALNAEMDGRVNLNLAGKVCFKIDLRPHETPIELMRETLDKLTETRGEEGDGAKAAPSQNK